MLARTVVILLAVMDLLREALNGFKIILELYLCATRNRGGAFKSFDVKAEVYSEGPERPDYN